jgi:hypothetical protein
MVERVRGMRIPEQRWGNAGDEIAIIDKPIVPERRPVEEPVDKRPIPDSR